MGVRRIEHLPMAMCSCGLRNRGCGALGRGYALKGPAEDGAEAGHLHPEIGTRCGGRSKPKVCCYCKEGAVGLAGQDAQRGGRESSEGRGGRQNGPLGGLGTGQAPRY